MDKAEHRERHKALHKAFDELLADYITHTGGSIHDEIFEIMKWSNEQTKDPDEGPMVMRRPGGEIQRTH